MFVVASVGFIAVDGGVEMTTTETLASVEEINAEDLLVFLFIHESR